MDLFVSFLKVTVAFGILNVWLLRPNKKTPYRGGKTKNLKEEFGFYGLPHWFFCLVGVIKISSAIALLLSFSYPNLSLVASSIIFSLMVGAIVMHIKSGDSVKKTLPAVIMFIMSGVICFYSFYP